MNEKWRRLTCERTWGIFNKKKCVDDWNFDSHHQEIFFCSKIIFINCVLQLLQIIKICSTWRSSFLNKKNTKKKKESKLVRERRYFFERVKKVEHAHRRRATNTYKFQRLMMVFVWGNLFFMLNKCSDIFSMIFLPLSFFLCCS